MANPAATVTVRLDAKELIAELEAIEAAVKAPPFVYEYEAKLDGQGGARQRIEAPTLPDLLAALAALGIPYDAKKT